MRAVMRCIYPIWYWLYYSYSNLIASSQIHLHPISCGEDDASLQLYISICRQPDSIDDEHSHLVIRFGELLLLPQ